MNRVVIRALPYASSSSSSSSEWWHFLVLVPCFSIVVVVAATTALATFIDDATFVHDKTTPILIRWKFETAIFSLVLIIMLHYHRTKNRKHTTFVEAIVEVSPLGVQLLSIYGSSSSSSSSSSSETMITTSTSTSSRKTKEVVQYHAFLPFTCILDVTVREVVWSHRVWSQVVFRIHENYYADNYNADPGVQQQQDERRRIVQKKLADRGTTITTIIPAFYPNECQRMMTYVECLAAQAQIEELMMCNFPTNGKRRKGVE